jgi:DNA-binding response OmpR family regulator
MPSIRVLCIEDDADTRDMLKAMLGYSDLEAVVSPDISAVLRLMQSETV